MILKRILCLSLLSAFSLYASEIKLDGTYSSLLGNPFKAKLEIKNSDIAVVNVPSQIVAFNVETNTKEFFGASKPDFSIDANACTVVLKSFFSEDYNLNSKANKSVVCEILPSNISLVYALENERHINQLSDIIVELNVRVKMTENAKELFNQVLSTKMNKDLNKQWVMQYNLNIKKDFKFDALNTEKEIQKIVEHAIYDLLNKNVKGK